MSAAIRSGPDRQIARAASVAATQKSFLKIIGSKIAQPKNAGARSTASRAGGPHRPICIRDALRPASTGCPLNNGITSDSAMPTTAAPARRKR